MILACPTCDSRYDVTAYAPGRPLRCRCGTVTAVPQLASVAGMLACPNCGAGVAATASSCEHCGTALLQANCPRCFQRVFAGHKHCPDCGCELDIAPAAGELEDLACPRCDQKLRARLVGNTVIDECEHCLGAFLDHAGLRRLLRRASEDRTDESGTTLPAAVPKHVTATVQAGARMYVKCPHCHNVMNRQLIAGGAIVDICKAHGTFFDAGELHAVIAHLRAARD